MAEGRSEEIWSVASVVMSVIANCHITKKKDKVKPSDFLPPSMKKKVNANVLIVTKENVGVFRREFMEVVAREKM